MEQTAPAIKPASGLASDDQAGCPDDRLVDTFEGFKDYLIDPLDLVAAGLQQPAPPKAGITLEPTIGASGYFPAQIAAASSIANLKIVMALCLLVNVFRSGIAATSSGHATKRFAMHGPVGRSFAPLAKVLFFNLLTCCLLYTSPSPRDRG